MTATSLSPDLAAAMQALRAGRAQECMQLAERAAQDASQAARAWWLYASAAMALRRMADAEQGFAKGAGASAPGSSEQVRFLVERARPLIEEGRMADAVATVRAALVHGIAEPEPLVLAAFTLTHAGLAEEALPLARQACETAPGNAHAWYNLGTIHEFLGDRQAAQDALEHALSTSQGRLIPAHYSLAHLRRWTARDNHVGALEAAECRSPADAARIAYALFKEYDDLDRRDAAWDCLQHGARIMRGIEPWSAGDEAATNAAWKRTFPADASITGTTPPPRERVHGGPRRIFVVGLPRSGTTLVERVLAAHSQVHAMGEPKALAIAVRRLSGLADAPLLDARVVEAASRIDPHDLAAFYARETEPIGAGKPVTVDKRVQNLSYLGLIRRAFPDAAILAVDRNPMDALFGAYKRLFAGSHGWSYSIEDLAAHYRNHCDMLDYWSGQSAMGVIRITLEQLIAEPEVQIRRLIEACGLPFEDACLRPHEARGAVLTASASQVRQPINDSGIGAWRRYERQLAPLRERLSAIIGEDRME